MYSKYSYLIDDHVILASKSDFASISNFVLSNIALNFNVRTCCVLKIKFG